MPDKKKCQNPKTNDEKYKCLFTKELRGTHNFEKKKNGGNQSQALCPPWVPLTHTRAVPCVSIIKPALVGLGAEVFLRGSPQQH